MDKKELHDRGQPKEEARVVRPGIQDISSKRFVDLTHSFSPLTPVWKGFGQATFSRAADPKTGRPYTVDKDGFQTFYYSMVGQYGTHIDAPAHFDSNGMTLDEIPLKQMILPLVVFDITAILKKDPSHVLTVADIEDWERKYGRVPVGCFVALRTLRLSSSLWGLTRTYGATRFL